MGLTAMVFRGTAKAQWGRSRTTTGKSAREEAGVRGRDAVVRREDQVPMLPEARLWEEEAIAQMADSGIVAGSAGTTTGRERRGGAANDRELTGANHGESESTTRTMKGKIRGRFRSIRDGSPRKGARNWTHFRHDSSHPSKQNRLVGGPGRSWPVTKPCRGESVHGL